MAATADGSKTRTGQPTTPHQQPQPGASFYLHSAAGEMNDTGNPTPRVGHCNTLTDRHRRRMPTELADAIEHYSQANDLNHPNVGALRHHIEHHSISAPTLYRGMYGQHLSGTPYPDLHIGHTFRLQSASTSTDRDEAAEFSWNDFDGDDEHDYSITLELHNAHGVRIANHSLFPEQQEWVTRDATYQITDITAGIDGDPHIIHIVAHHHTNTAAGTPLDHPCTPH